MVANLIDCFTDNDYFFMIRNFLFFYYADIELKYFIAKKKSKLHWKILFNRKIYMNNLKHDEIGWEYKCISHSFQSMMTYHDIKG